MKQLPFPRRIPFVEELGLELWAFGDGQAELQAELQLALCEQHMNSYLVGHGGVLMTLLDVAMAHAARSANLVRDAAGGGVCDAGPGVVTIEMKTSFMRAAEGRLRACATLLHKTTTMAFTEGSVFNAAGQLCAHATGTFKYIKALPMADRAVRPLLPNQETSR